MNTHKMIKLMIYLPIGFIWGELGQVTSNTEEGGEERGIDAGNVSCRMGQLNQECCNIAVVVCPLLDVIIFGYAATVFLLITKESGRI